MTFDSESGTQHQPVPHQSSRPTPAALLGTWLNLGWQSFGGGASTLTLIRRACIEQNPWITEDEFNRFWALVQLAPGINLLALTILIGKRIAGWRGILICLTGMLLPSFAITVLLTACYAHIEDLAVVKAALRGIVPATVGLGALTAWNMGGSQLKESQPQGRRVLAAHLLILFGCMAAVTAGRVPILLGLVGGGVAGAFAAGLRTEQSPVRPEAGE